MVFNAASAMVNGYRDDERMLLAGMAVNGPFD
jgi:hypothetical protein